jgi:hypothetical protein
MNRIEEIPVPVAGKDIDKDLRKQYLDQWKELFQAIDKNIYVFTQEDEGFEKLHHQWIGRRDFDSTMRRYVVLIIILQNNKDIIQEYIIGLTHNRMFSNIQIEEDIRLIREQEMDVSLLPKTFSWEEVYVDLCEQVHKERKQIFPPIWWKILEALFFKKKKKYT